MVLDNSKNHSDELPNNFANNKSNNSFTYYNTNTNINNLNNIFPKKWTYLILNKKIKNVSGIRDPPHIIYTTRAPIMWTTHPLISTQDPQIVRVTHYMAWKNITYLLVHE